MNSCMYGLTLQPYISQVPSAYNVSDVLDSTDAILMNTSADFSCKGHVDCFVGIAGSEET